MVICALLLALLSALIYANSLRAPFLFDDAGAVVNNPTIRDLTSWRIFAPPGDGSTTTGRPLVNASFAINYAISGTEPWSYHAGNIVLHALASILVFALLRRVVAALGAAGGSQAERIPGRSAVSGPGPLEPSGSWLAFALAAVWAVHPLNTETVVCVAQRTEGLSAVFYLLTLYTFVRSTESAQRASAWLSVSVIACALGMASKETVVTAPVMVLLYDRTFVSGSFSAAWRRRWKYYLGLAACWAVLAVLVLGAGASRGVSAGFGLGVSPWAYLLTQCQALVLYLKLSLWPHPLVVDYGTAVVTSVGAVAWQAAVVLALLGATVWALLRRPILGFAGAWFFVILAPSSSFVPLVSQTMAEHRMYLPLLAVLALAALGLRRWAGGLVMPGLLLLAAVLAPVTVARNQVYGDELELWRANVADWPSGARGHNNLARLLQARGQAGPADAEYARAVELDPGYVLAHYNWGVALLQDGNSGRAADQLAEAVRLAPGFADARLNYGVALLRAGKPGEALGQLQAALELQPDAPDILFNLGVALEATGRRSEAVHFLSAAAEARPDLADAQLRLARLAAESGNTAEGLTRYEAAVRAAPGLAPAHAEFGLVLARSGELAAGAKQLEAALRLDPTNPDTRANLGNVYLLLGEPRRAIEQYEQALQLRPGDARTEANLQVARDALSQSGG